MTLMVNRRLGFVLLGALALAGWIYRESYAGIVRMWDTDASFSHGVLIPPIVLWLVWRRREDLLAVPWIPSWWGAAGCLIATAVWVVSRGVGVQAAEQLAVVAMVPALVLGVLGSRALRVVGLPMFLLVFAVPFGKGLMPWLMKITADLSVKALTLTGVPVHRSGMMLSIPGGDFEVARACSGLNYLTVGVVLGVIYASLVYRSWFKRAVFIAASVIVPILANTLRVFLTITVAHYSNMRYGTGLDHIIGGRILFIVLLVLMFWIGRRWADAPAKIDRVANGDSAPGARARWQNGLILVGCFVALSIGPTLLHASISNARASASAGSAIWLPNAAAGWRGPDTGPATWAPAFSGATYEQRGSYWNSADQPVEVFVGEYLIGAQDGREMIAYGNYVVPRERESLLPERRAELSLGNDARLTVREITIRDALGVRVVWLWYRVGSHTTVSGWGAKLLEGLEFILRQGATERVISISAKAVDREAALDRLNEFARAHVACIASGFEPSGCAE